jgi:hypothetical protein
VTRRLVAVPVVLIVLVGALWFVGRTRGIGPFSPEHWVNVKTGAVAGIRYTNRHQPFELSDGCGGGTYTSSISWLRGWYLQGYTGPNGVTAPYEADAALPSDAVFSGWQRSDRQLWIAPSELTEPGTYRSLYVVHTGPPKTVERWPRAEFGCA